MIATAIVSSATHTPAVWAAPGAVLIASMWIARRPRRSELRAMLSAAIVLSVVGAVLISPAVLLAWPAAALARVVRGRGIGAARVPLTVAAAIAALAIGAAQLGLPAGVAILAIIPLALITRRSAGALPSHSINPALNAWPRDRGPRGSCAQSRSA